jgi:hypothetical protein
MRGRGHVVQPNLESEFHAYDRLLRENLALRRLHGPLDGDEARPPTGLPRAALAEENARLREALARRGVRPPSVAEGPVQPTEALAEPRRHVPVGDPTACPVCGEPATSRVCRCGFVRPKRSARRPYAEPPPLPVPRPSLPPPVPQRPLRWDLVLAWLVGVPVVLAGALWLLQPILR